ncbi:undecaprenyl-diphosphate phosphatase [Priestia taiwanensis]|uniref:Undecaprenyl-diphosphatase n=1 Tax=Priestia taiwanensis TaxID=1347902 RepID=A0A917ARY9_9BACI|nr:undecaprenyl-diphosphate phosphatase [Priestia taiwanensis]MBM7363902.1 undecaprenyl-diphosphatase [Priestia taiwanensis]GGE69966.1 undecaprenyl-diphosphatase 2 [Priestia taiwanensis]
MADWLIGIIMGIVEGLTEFLPVSSTGHLILTAEILNFQDDPRASIFEVVIQLGSILAVVVVFWKRLWSIVGVKTEGYKSSRLNVLHIILGGIPAIVVGLLLHDWIKANLFSMETVLVSLVAGGILMIAAEVLPKGPKIESLDDMTYKQAFTIGLFQVLALWPGFSRSGSTMSGGMFAGVSRKTAAEFSFILAVPMMVGASGLDIVKNLDKLSTADLTLFASGFVTAFIVAMFAIFGFLKLLESVKLTTFAIYRFILAIAFYIVFIM